MTVESVLADFEGEDFIYPRFVEAKSSFNGKGSSLYYYIHGKDSDGYVAGLRLDFFNDVRFTNFKKPHPTPHYTPYHDKFRNAWSCSHKEISEGFVSSRSATKAQLAEMADHWKVPVNQFINTLEIAYELLIDAENEGWINSSAWEGGDFKGPLPPPKR